MEGGRAVVDNFALAVGVVSNTTGTVTIRIEWMKRAGRAASTTMTKSSSSLSLDAESLDRPDQGKESLVVVRIEAGVEGRVSNLDLGAG